jgi:hypothetical protein
MSNQSGVNVSDVGGVPEPSSIVLAATGALLLLICKKRQSPLV